MIMRKKYGRLRKSENVIVFPGTFERLVAKGIDCVKHKQFEKAVEAFDQAIIFEPDYPDFWGRMQSRYTKQKIFIVLGKLRQGFFMAVPQAISMRWSFI